ncbi:MAG: SRPBCC domain-containing protein [Kineosporiaceae bacterium]|jgi:uncharacterized protein YndB with AHSA1/START domain
MSVTDVRKDPETLAMTLTAEFAAGVEQVWRLWQDPRQLERWWGPPTYPATMVEHDLSPGGKVSYFMTSPEGEQYHGWWLVTEVEAPYRLAFEDGFADGAGVPNPDMPVTTTEVRLTEDGTGTRMTIETRFPSLEAMEQLVQMGMEEGLTLAVGQMDALLSDIT